MGVLLLQRGLYTFLGVCLSYSQLVILRLQACFKFLTGHRLLLPAPFELLAGIRQAGLLFLDRSDLRTQPVKFRGGGVGRGLLLF